MFTFEQYMLSSWFCVYVFSHVAAYCGFYHQGGKIRAKLVAELSGAEGVVIEEGTSGEVGKAAARNGMRR